CRIAAPNAAATAPAGRAASSPLLALRAPAADARERAPPALHQGARVLAAHARLELALGTPVRGQLLEIRPHAGRETREVGGSERGSLEHPRANHAPPEEVGLKLQQQVVRGRAPVGAQLRNLAPG